MKLEIESYVKKVNVKSKVLNHILITHENWNKIITTICCVHFFGLGPWLSLRTKLWSFVLALALGLKSLLSCLVNTFKIIVNNHGATRWWRSHDASFLHFDTIPACDGRTDGRTRCSFKDPRRHSIARVKNKSKVVVSSPYVYDMDDDWSVSANDRW